MVMEHQKILFMVFAYLKILKRLHQKKLILFSAKIVKVVRHVIPYILHIVPSVMMGLNCIKSKTRNMAFALLKIWKRCYLKKHILTSAKTENNALYVMALMRKNLYIVFRVRLGGHYNQ